MQDDSSENDPPKTKSWFLGGSPLQAIVGWIIFIGAIAVAFKVLEMIFGCVSEFGRNYC